MSRSMARTTAQVLTTSILAGAIMFGLAAPAMALPMAPVPTKIDPAGISTILSKHNAARDEVKVGHLSWDNGLAAHAQVYADKLAVHDPAKPDHDKTELKGLNENENLSKSWGYPPLEYAVSSWYGEKAAYLAEPNKTTYTQEPAKEFRHYTQMVWSKTTKVGCGLATSASGKNYVSCRYSPPGNINGQLPYGPNQGPDVGPSTSASISSLAAIGVDYSVQKAELTSWLNNPNYTPYPAIGNALLRLLPDRKLRRPVYIDVIVFKYEKSPGVKSPRKAEDVNMATLKKAVLVSSNERYGENVNAFEALLAPKA